MKLFATVGALCAVVLLPVHAAAASSAADEPPPRNLSIATYGDQTLDLAVSWGTARACLATETETTCFASEKEMNRYITSLGVTSSKRGGGLAVIASNCASSVRLYTNTSYGGYVLEIWVRSVVIDLAGFSFSDLTSSYKIGACAAYFWDGVGGGGVYPGNTNVGVWSSSMVAGWDNRVSSLVLG